MRFYSDPFQGIGDTIRFLGIDYTPIPTSGFAPIIFWRIWALETIVNNLKPIANFRYLNVFFLYQ